MDKDMFEEELTQLTTRKGLFLKGGAAAAGLTVLGSPTAAAFAASKATIKVAVVTHGDTGSFWSVFKKGVDQAAKDLKSRGVSVTQVYADGAGLDAPWVGELDDVDVAAAILHLSGGGLVIVSGTRRDPLGYDVRLEVFGTGDSIVVGQDAHSPIRSVEPDAKAPGATYRDFWDRFEPAYRSELAAFVETVRTGAPSPCSLEEARSALTIALAADLSRAERRPVSIEEVELAQAPPNS